MAWRRLRVQVPSGPPLQIKNPAGNGGVFYSINQTIKLRGGGKDLLILDGKAHAGESDRSNCRTCRHWTAFSAPSRNESAQ